MQRRTALLLFTGALLLTCGFTRAARAEDARPKPCPDLFIAIGKRDNPTVRRLLASGISPETCNSIDISALAFAAVTGNREALDLLIEAGAQINRATIFGTAIEAAALSGQSDLVRRLLSKGAQLKPARPDRISALMHAARIGDGDLIRTLLAAGSDPNEVDNHGSTALSYASREGNTAAATILLQAGARADLADSDGWTPLMYAAANGRTDSVRLLGGLKPGVNARDKQGRTALLLAASLGDHPDTVQALLDLKSDATVRDAKQRTACGIAAVRGHSASLEILRRAGVEVPAALPPLRTAREAAQLSLRRVSSAIGTFASRTGCISCHHEGVGSFALAFARNHGYTPDQKTAVAAEARVGGMMKGLSPLFQKALDEPEQIKMLPVVDLGDLPQTLGILLLGMSEAKTAPAPELGQAVQVMARLQDPDGAWRFALQRGPSQSSYFATTAMAIRAIQAYWPADAREGAARSISLARKWLSSAPAESTEDLAFRLLALKWAGADEAECARAAAALQAAQRADGGWGQTKNDRSDAYATGTALYALNQGGGMKPAHETYRRGTAYLIRTQDDSGAWYVRKRAMPANNYFDAGYPYGQSQYISHLAGSWATVALIIASGDSGGQPAASLPTTSSGAPRAAASE